MKRNKGCFTKRCVRRRIDLSKATARTAIGLTTLLLGLTTVGTPPHAAAMPVCGASIRLRLNPTVYLFNSANTPVLMPSATIHEGGIYTDGVLLGVLDENDTIVDGNANIIGYVLYPSPD